jgi:hypothetical protein
MVLDDDRTHKRLLQIKDSDRTFTIRHLQAYSSICLF